MINRSETLAIVLGTLGVVFMVASGFQIMPWKWAIFLGVACFIFAAMMRRIAGNNRRSG
jgi:hypothetical protein